MSQVIAGRRFATHVREARDSLGLGREKLAARLGLSSGTIENWETGKLPTLPNLRLVCEYFGWDEREAVGWVLEDMADRSKGPYFWFVAPLVMPNAA